MLDGQPIPGQTPLPDLSGLRDASIRTVGELNACEAENIRRAVVRYLAARPSPRRAPFDEPWLRALHRQMLGDVWSWAGTYRRHETNIGSPPPRIAVEVHGLVDDLQAWRRSSMDILEQAVRLHHRAVQIHPFANGNGRWSRMLASTWLRLHGHAPVEWPEAAIGGASIIRGEYLDALRAADAGDIAPLRRLHERHLSQPSDTGPMPQAGSRGRRR